VDLATIGVTEEEALAKFEEYRAAVRERHNLEDEAIMRGYQQIVKGRRLINLTATFAAGGFDDQGRPRLAMARATDERVRVDISPTLLTFFPAAMGRRPPSNAGLNGGVLRVDIERRSRAGWDTPEAIVPIVPPGLRPHRALAKHWILFEADWQAPPRDPALVRHIAGDLWTVLATWNLTELERAVLARR